MTGPVAARPYRSAYGFRTPLMKSPRAVTGAAIDRAWSLDPPMGAWPPPSTMRPLEKGKDVIQTYTIPEASELTGIPKTTLYDAYHAGKLEAGLKRGAKRGLRVTGEAIDKFWKELVKESGQNEKADQA